MQVCHAHCPKESGIPWVILSIVGGLLFILATVLIAMGKPLMIVISLVVMITTLSILVMAIRESTREDSNGFVERPADTTVVVTQIKKHAIPLGSGNASKGSRSANRSNILSVGKVGAEKSDAKSLPRLAGMGTSIVANSASASDPILVEPTAIFRPQPRCNRHGSKSTSR